MYGNEEGSISEEGTRKYLTAVFKVCDYYKPVISLRERETCRVIRNDAMRYFHGVHAARMLHLA